MTLHNAIFMSTDEPTSTEFENVREFAEQKGYGWIEKLRNAKDEQVAEGYHVLVFRMQSYWFACSSEVVKEVFSSIQSHRIPHGRNPDYTGIVNIRGRLGLGISLRSIFELKSEEKGDSLSISRRVYPRHVLIENAGESYVFATDEVYGLVRFEKAELDSLVRDVEEPLATYLVGQFQFKERAIGLIDEELLFYRLNHRFDL